MLLRNNPVWRELSTLAEVETPDGWQAAVYSGDTHDGRHLVEVRREDRRWVRPGKLLASFEIKRNEPRPGPAWAATLVSAGQAAAVIVEALVAEGATPDEASKAASGIWWGSYVHQLLPRIP